MVRDLLRQQLREDEGTGPTRDSRMLPYFDCCGKFFRLCTCQQQGKLTIGWGRNLEDNGISYAEGETLLDHDIHTASKLVLAQHPWTAALDSVRFAVLVNMMFNMGPKTLSQFVQTLRAIQEGEYANAAKMMLQSVWAKQVGKRAVRLSKQMESGTWQN